MMTKLRKLERAKLDADLVDPAEVTEAKRKAIEAAWEDNENAPIEVDKRLKANKAELKVLMPYIKTLRKKPLWDELQK
jgi:hypothetical protein